MRRTRIVAIIAGLLMAAPALAQYPAEAVILLPEVEVRGGPSKTFFATSKLRQNERVTVLRESKEDPRWLEIRPPQLSFSWINQKYVKMIDATHGAVETDSSRPIDILPGSRLVNEPPNRVSMKLVQGTTVVLVDRPTQAGGETWLPILPHQNEVRYIPAEAVRPATQVTAQANAPTNWTLGGNTFTTDPLLAEAERAEAAGDNARARALYQQLANTTVDQNRKRLAQDKLYRLPTSNVATGITTSNPKDETRTVFSPGGAANLVKLKDAAWSQYGRLYETKLPSENGQPLYKLDLGQGQSVYVTTPPGKTLQSYIGRMIAVYGPEMYRGDSMPRLQFIVESHVAMP